MDLKFLKHPILYEYECLESYLHRLANENLAPYKWVLDYFGLKPIFYKSPSDYYDIKFNKIAYAASLSKQTIRNMTSYGFLGVSSFDYVFYDLISYNTSKFCPECLKEQSYPRIYWQFNLLNICHKHNSILISKCPSCNTDITVQMIINGMCTCGAKLEAVEPIYCQQNDLLEFNKTLYAAHNIANDEKIFFNKLSGQQYLKFVCTLILIMREYKDIFSQDWIPKQEEYGGNADLFLEYLLCRILDDWPYKLFLILDDIYYSGIDYRRRDIFNPIFDVAARCLPLIDNTEYNFINRLFFQYLRSRYNYDYFVKKFESKIVKNKYLSTDDLSEVFGISDCEIFRIHEISNGTYVEISDVFKLFDVIFQKVEPTYSIDDVELEYSNFSRRLRIRPLSKRGSIYKYIERLRQPIHITDYTGGGINMFSFPSN